MTLDNLTQAGLSVYVRNNASSAGRIAIDFTVNGRKQVVPIPNTWIAIRLNDFMSAGDVASSGSLRDMLRKGIVLLVHPDDAEKEWSSERGQRELARYRSNLAKDSGVPVARVTNEADKGRSEVSDRMKSFVIELQDIKDSAAKQDCLDKIFANIRSFVHVDVEYLQVKCQTDADAQKLATEMFVELAKRS